MVTAGNTTVTGRDTMSSTHIRVQESVKDRLLQMSREKESIGEVITRLMDYYDGVTTDGNNPLSLVNPDVTRELTDRMESLEQRLHALESGFQQVNDEPDSPTSSRTDDGAAPRERKQSAAREGKVHITPDMCEELKDRVSYLHNEMGMTYPQISDKTGIPVGSLKKIPPGILKSIGQNEFDALMLP